MPKDSPPAAVPAHTIADLDAPLWWLDRAEAECNADPNLRQRLFPALVSLRLAAGDTAGAQGTVNALASAQPSQAQGTPAAEAQLMMARYKARQLARDGRLAEALEVANTVADGRPELNFALSDVAVEQAGGGDLDGAVATIARLDKGLAARTFERAVRDLLADGKTDDAKRLAAQADGFSRQLAYGRLAEGLAAAGDIDGAITALANVQANERVVSLSRALHSIATLGDDAGATRLVESMPTDQQTGGWATLAQAQLDRDDIEAAIATSAKLSGNSAFSFRRSLAVARIRLGQADRAIAALAANHSTHENVDAVFAALLQYGPLESAASLLQRLPPSDTGPRTTRPEQLARAYADAGRPAEAEAILAAYPADEGTEQIVARRNLARWAIAAAYRRSGNHAAYEAIRKPLIDAVAHAPGAPSRSRAQIDLLALYLIARDFEAAESLAPQMNPREVATLAAQLGKPAMPGSGPPLSASDSRALAKLMIVNLDRNISRTAIASAAKVHTTGQQRAHWLNWVQQLPTASSRATAYTAMAASLLPKQGDN